MALTKSAAKTKEESANKPSTSTSKKKNPDSCCSGTSCSTSQKESSPKSKTSSNSKLPARVVIHYDCGFSNSLYLRGNGGKLNWDKGVQMKNQGPNTWIWECNSELENCEFKVLLNDQVYESGSNHIIKKGASCEYTPHFDYT